MEVLIVKKSQKCNVDILSSQLLFLLRLLDL